MLSLPALLLALSLVSSPDSGAQETAGRALASVRGVSIRDHDWPRVISLFPDLLEGAATEAPAGTVDEREALARVLEDRLLEREIEERSLASTELGMSFAEGAERAALALWVQEVGLAGEFTLTSDELRAAYEARADRYNRPDQIVLSHIYFRLSGLDPQAAESRRRAAADTLAVLRQAPERFNELAMERSESTTPAGEQISLDDPLQIHESLRDPLWSAQRGEITDVLESPAGLHIFRIDQRLRRSHSIEDVAPFLANRLFQEWLWATRVGLEQEAESRFGLTLHPLPPTLVASSTLVSGSDEVTGEDLQRWGRLDLRWLPEPNYLRETMLSAQREAVWLALAREREWTDEPSLQEALENARFTALRQALWITRLREASLEVTSADVEAAYRRDLESFTHPVALTVREIRLAPASAGAHSGAPMIQLYEQAERLRARALGGEDFVTLGRGSLVPLDLLEPHVVYPPVDPAAASWLTPLAALSTGEISAPLQRGQEISLFQILSRVSDAPEPIESVGAIIYQRLFNERLAQIQEEWRAQVRSEIEWGDFD